MDLALNNLKRVDMPLNKETNQPKSYMIFFRPITIGGYVILIKRNYTPIVFGTLVQVQADSDVDPVKKRVIRLK